MGGVTPCGRARLRPSRRCAPRWDPAADEATTTLTPGVDELDAWKDHPAQLIRVPMVLVDENARIAVSHLDSTRIGARFSRITVLGSSRAIVIEGLAAWVAEQCQLVRALEQNFTREADVSRDAAPESRSPR